jgi:hypothetical protein
MGFRKLRDLSRPERRLFSEALFLQLLVGLLLMFIPFKWIPHLFANPPANRSQGSDLDLIKVAIQRSGRYSPWKNKCLVGSLAGRCMLRRRRVSSQFSLGVAKDANGKTIAHAWLKAGDFEIVEEGAGFTELYLF